MTSNTLHTLALINDHANDLHFDFDDPMSLFNDPIYTINHPPLADFDCFEPRQAPPALSYGAIALAQTLERQRVLNPALYSVIASIYADHDGIIPFSSLSLMNSEAIDAAMLYACVMRKLDIGCYFDMIIFVRNNLFPQANVWVEDLTDQGVEPNPGPSDNTILQNTDVAPVQVAPPIPPAPIAPPPGFFQIILGVYAALPWYTFYPFLLAFPISFLYTLFAMSLNRRVLPPHRRLPVAINLRLAQFLILIAQFLIGYFVTRLAILLLLLIAGVEPNPGPSILSKPESFTPCESPEDTSAAKSPDLSRDTRRSRSKEKRNSKFSHATLCSLLEQQKLEKRLTCLRQAQRRSKNTRWESPSPITPVVPHNIRRLERFLAQKKSEPQDIQANSFVKKLFVKCCAQKDDSIYRFLVDKCRFDELTSMTLAPVIKGLKNMLTSKVTVGIALCILAYYLAKYVGLNSLIFAPVIAMVLHFVIDQFSDKILAAFLALYNSICTAFAAANHLCNETTVTHETFPHIDSELTTLCLSLHKVAPEWKAQFAQHCRFYEAPPRKTTFCLDVPNVVYNYLKVVNDTGMDLNKLASLYKAHEPASAAATPIIANSLPEVIADLTSPIRDVFASVNLISETFQLPQALSCYSSSKKFVKQLHEVYQDLYPSIYEFVTGKTYVPPEIAKYLNIFGEISTKVHATLKKSRQSNIVREDHQFRLQIISEYEQLLEAQMKLLALKAPTNYMIPLNRLVTEMSKLADDCYARARGEAIRDEPVLIFLRGPPGVGKTTIDHALALIIGQRLGIDVNVLIDFFSREVGVEHWDGYENQMFVTFDDAFQITDPEKQAQTILEIIKAKNSAAYKLIMAQLENKKNSFFNSKFIFISTNVDNVVCDQIADIGAFYRRIDFDVSVKERPQPNADGSVNFNYDITVNGQKSDITTLADSIVALHKQREVADSNISSALADFVRAQPITPIANLIGPRNSTKSFAVTDNEIPRPSRKAPKPPAKDDGLILPNGLVEVWKRVKHTIYPNAPSSTVSWTRYFETLLADSTASIDKLSKLATEYAKWLALAAITFTAALILRNLWKVFSQTIFPNSRKEKDKLTGDKKTIHTTNQQDVREQIKRTQAKLDKKAVKQQTKNIANSSSQRWSQAMIAYIERQGWQSKQCVADSLANITFIEELTATEQEMSDLHSLKRNVVDITTYYSHDNTTYQMFGKALILDQDHLITPSHQMPRNCRIENVELNFNGKVVNIKNHKAHHIENADTCVLTLSTFLPHREIGYMFHPLSDVTTAKEEIYLLRNFDDDLTICPVSDFQALDRQVEYRTDYNEVISCGTIFQSKVAVCVGDSGCFYVQRHLGRFRIVGMHVSSSTSVAYGRFMSKEMFNGYIKPPRKATTPFANIAATIESTSRAFDHTLAVNSNCIPIGIVKPRTMIASRSKIHRSMLYKDKNIPPPEEAPADLRRTYDEEDPLLKSNAKFRLRNEPDIPITLKNEILHALLDEHPNFTRTTFYSNKEAVEGTEDMPRMNMTSSSGYPYSAVGKTPKNVLNENDWIEITNCVDNMLEDLYNGNPPQAIYQTSFKDETRPPHKVKNPRVVNCASIALTILFRRVLGPWMNMVHANHNNIRTKVGVNAHGVDWKLMFDSFVKVSPENIIELDYKGYEYNHPQFGYMLAADFIYLLALRSGFSERDARAMKLLVQSCCAGYVLQGEVLVYVWMLLSGLPITAELNSLLNCIYQMTCYKFLTQLPLIEMRSKVASAFYGDDLGHAVSDSIKEKFNALTVQRFCAEFLEMEVTPASNKQGVMSQFIHILDFSFLCRKFAPRDNRVDAPLKISSCTDSLQYYIPVAHMTQSELISAKCTSFITELSHYPREIFDYWSKKLAVFKSEHGLLFVNYDYDAALNRRVSGQLD